MAAFAVGIAHAHRIADNHAAHPLPRPVFTWRRFDYRRYCSGCRYVCQPHRHRRYLVWRLAAGAGLHLVLHVGFRADAAGSGQPLSGRRQLRHLGERPARPGVEWHYRAGGGVCAVCAHLCLYFCGRRFNRPKPKRHRANGAAAGGAAAVFCRAGAVRGMEQPLGRAAHQRVAGRDGHHLSAGHRPLTRLGAMAAVARQRCRGGHALLAVCAHRAAGMPGFVWLSRQCGQPV